MFAIKSKDIRSLQGDSEQFTCFVDSLIYASAHYCHQQDSQISTNQRTNIPDGGVDTEVRWKTDLPWLSWFDVPTCWQYKATAKGNIDPSGLREEVNKPYARVLIQQGYGYRFCICDNLPPSNKDKWETVLWEEISQMNDKAPKPKVITVDDLSYWVNNFPGLIIRFFRPYLEQVLHIDAWRQSITTLTKHFVPALEWNNIREAILKHVNFNETPSEVILPLQGKAGVGKTRFVYECLAAEKTLRPLVLYVEDEDKARDIAYGLANDARAKAILVADECSLSIRNRLKELLGGHKDRIRVISIDNAWDREYSGSPKYWLSEIPENIMEEVVKKNFPHIPHDRRRRYISLAKGFVRFVAFLCMHDQYIVASGHIEPALDEIWSCVSERIGEKGLRTLEALSLFQKVGFKGDCKDELDELCKLVGMDETEFKRTAKSLKDVPGFVGIAGRYFYVTPEVIAQKAFKNAWRYWIEDDPDEFLNRLPSQLQKSFLDRVSMSAGREERRIVSAFFQSWTASFTPDDLCNPEKVERLEVLATVEPEKYFPLIRDVVKVATDDQLMRDSGDYFNKGKARRTLVWLTEKFAAFPEHFYDVEYILLRLALAETEPGIGNNATEIWKQLFRIYLSGTAVPFCERIQLLEKRIFSKDIKTSKLAIEALNQIPSPHHMRMGRESIVAGRFPPRDWHPESPEEQEKCLESVVELLLKMARSDASHLRRGAVDIIIGNMRVLLARGYLGKLRELFSSIKHLEPVLPKLIEAVDDFLYFECSNEKSPLVISGYVEEIKKWISTFIPKDFHGKLVSVVGVDQWHYELRERKEEWEKQLRDLAKELCENTILLDKELPWLCSDNAKSAGVLGGMLGQCDEDCRHLELIVEAAMQTEYTIFAKGYLNGLLQKHPQHTSRVNKILDTLERQKPRVTYELFIVCGEKTKAFERTLKLVDAGILDEVYFGTFLKGYNRKDLSLERFRQILERLLPKIREGNDDVRRLTIDGIALRLRDEKKRGEIITINDRDIQPLIWEILERTHSRDPIEAYWWCQILEAMIDIDPDRAIAIACSAMLGNNYSFKEEAEKLLSGLASKFPDKIIRHLGDAIMNEDKSYRYSILKLTPLFKQLPFEIVQKWLEGAGVEGARRIARHLPEPYVDEDGHPVLHPLTEYVFTEFEDDDRILEEFCAGVHSFRVLVGDISEVRKKDAEIAECFLNHRLRRVREWAAREKRWAEQDAKRWREQNEEYWLR